MSVQTEESGSVFFSKKEKYQKYIEEYLKKCGLVL